MTLTSLLKASLSRLPISRKVILIIFITTSIALLVSMSLILAYDRNQYLDIMQKEIRILSRVIALRSTAALTFLDKQLARENLLTMAEKKTVQFACIYDQNNDLFSHYTKQGKAQNCNNLVINQWIDGIHDGAYFLSTPIVLDGVSIGTIYVKTSLTEINSRLYTYVIIVFLVFMVTSVFAYLLGKRLQGVITEPIKQLAQTAHYVENNKDFTVRADKLTDDEVGELVNSFNKMIQAINERDKELLKAQEGLERKVKERTRELKDAQNELIKSERMATLGQLTATVSHEIRNPLGTIRTSIFTLKNKVNNKDENLRKIMERIQRNVIRCDNIITELLDYTRIRALNHEVTNVARWIEQVVNEMELSDNIHVLYDVDRTLDLEMDKDLLRRVIVNLIDNASQSFNELSDAHNNEIKIKVCKHDNHAEICISDNGPGIPENIIPHIFEPLFSTKGFGIGLGLPIVRQIVEQHGGKINIVSNQQSGTVAMVVIPIQVSSQEQNIAC